MLFFKNIKMDAKDLMVSSLFLQIIKIQELWSYLIMYIDKTKLKFSINK